MNIPRSWWFAALAGLAVALLLPVLARRWRELPQQRCAFDGGTVNPAVVVSISSSRAADIEFCSLWCAEQWLAASGVRPQSIVVVDEATGVKLPAERAFYVRSQVVVHPPTRERRHVFARVEDARRHAADHHGVVLEGAERPLRNYLPRRNRGVNESQ